MYNFKYINLFNKEDEIKMSKKNILIEQIKQFDNKYFNEDQKTIAINILENAPEQEVQAYADFLFNKRRTGFAFDYSPEIAKGRLITLREDKDRRINVNDIISEDENKLIIGDNYNALKALLITHKEKIDVIYIDPPYNTESAKTDGNNDSYKEGTSSKFIYKDKFGRTGWLNMIKDRLTLAKDLMKDDGVIFVSIDDSEQAYLKVLMDEIFGEENFISINNILDNLKGKVSDKFISYTSHYVIMYSKNKKKLGKFNKIDQNKPLEEKYKLFDSNGIYTENPFKKTGSDSFRVDRPKSFYPILFNEKQSKTIDRVDFEELLTLTKEEDVQIFIDKIELKYSPNFDILWPIHEGKLGRWTYGYEGFKKLIETDDLIINKLNIKIKKRPSDEENISNSISGIPKNFVYKKEFANGTTELKKIGLDFSNPKSITLIKYLIMLIPNNNNLEVLDFFAGSGTTGQAVMELNREDEGNRKFILVTNNENNIAHDVTFERLHRIIRGKGTKQEKDFDWLKNNKPYNDAKLRVINIDDSVKISLDQEEIDETIFKDCKNGLKLLDNEYNKKGLNLYYDLSALNPIEKIEE